MAVSSEKGGKGEKGGRAALTRLSTLIECRTLLVMQPGRSLSENGKEFLKFLRLQLQQESAQIEAVRDLRHDGQPGQPARSGKAKAEECAMASAVR